MISKFISELASRIRLAFSRSRQPVLESPEEAAHAIVAARSHGNMRLQQGRFYTKTDLNERIERLRNIRFIDRDR